MLVSYIVNMMTARFGKLHTSILLQKKSKLYIKYMKKKVYIYYMTFQPLINFLIEDCRVMHVLMFLYSIIRTWICLFIKCRLHKVLVGGFMGNAKCMLVMRGQIHITHQIAYPFSKWNINELAENEGLLCVGEEASISLPQVTITREELACYVTTDWRVPYF